METILFRGDSNNHSKIVLALSARGSQPRTAKNSQRPRSFGQRDTEGVMRRTSHAAEDVSYNENLRRLAHNQRGQTRQTSTPGHVGSDSPGSRAIVSRRSEAGHWIPWMGCWNLRLKVRYRSDGGHAT